MIRVAVYVELFIVSQRAEVSVTLTAIALRFTILSTLFSQNSFVVTNILYI